MVYLLQNNKKEDLEFGKNKFIWAKRMLLTVFIPYATMLIYLTSQSLSSKCHIKLLKSDNSGKSGLRLILAQCQIGIRLGNDLDRMQRYVSGQQEAKIFFHSEISYVAKKNIYSWFIKHFNGIKMWLIEEDTVV